MRLVRLHSFAVVLSVVPVVLLAQGGAPGGPGQGRGGGGEPPKNLQVLPKDMPRNQVTAIMRTFTTALGVRCEHCHTEDPAAAQAAAAAAANAPAGGRGGRGGGPTLDYSLDDKETKKVAREMLKMVNDINGKYLPITGRTFNEFNRVSCETCHHGLAKPRTLRAAMTEAVQTSGADSAIALYRQLRLRYYGAAAYDFSEPSLNDAGNQIAQTPDNRKAAIAILKLNLEFFPQSLPTLTSLANVSVAAGDTAGALDAITRGLAIQPGNQQLTNLQQRIKPPGKP